MSIKMDGSRLTDTTINDLHQGPYPHRPITNWNLWLILCGFTTLALLAGGILLVKSKWVIAGMLLFFLCVWISARRQESLH